MNVQSVVGWLDADRAAQDSVAEFLRAFHEPGTLDSLGLGTVRDTLADIISPGVSTVQTRLRYFLFIPWICQQVEREQHSEFLDRHIRRLEARLIDCLKHLGRGEGVIGRVAGSRLKRMPSSIYWHGLEMWGILTPGPFRNRWAELPAPPESFLNGRMSLQLTEAEADRLCELLCSSPHSHMSVLARAAEGVRAAQDGMAVPAWPWEVPDGGLTDAQREVLYHAQSFSDTTEGPQIAYNLLLAERAIEFAGAESPHDDAERRSDEWRERLRDWADHITSSLHIERLRSWCGGLDAPDGFWAFCERQRRWPASPPTRDFVNRIAPHVLDDPSGLLDNGELRSLILEREVRLKGARARLGRHNGPIAEWLSGGMPFTGGRLDYRWSTVRRFLSDFAEAGDLVDSSPTDTPTSPVASAAGGT